MSKVSLILPAYHYSEDLYETTVSCLDSVWHEPIQLILIADDQPYTVNVNAGLRAATGDVLVVGNNDLVFENGWLAQLLPLLDAGYDIATCWTSDQKDVRIEERIEDNAKFGSLFAMTRKAYEILGPLDEQFRGYFSDLDYRRRALDAGLKIGKNLSLVVEHEAKATYKQTDPTDSEYLKSKSLFEAKWGFLE